jgi:hypothetical protein
MPLVAVVCLGGGTAFGAGDGLLWGPFEEEDAFTGMGVEMEVEVEVMGVAAAGLGGVGLEGLNE